jgi:glycosyltransferase involved in cell wall biosynthesis
VNGKESFRQFIKREFSERIDGLKAFHNDADLLKIDLHCHDHNSDKPDELWGRILRLPETWLESEALLGCLKNHHTHLATITNHNNAKSCWQLLDQGHDILPGAEFTCFFKEFDLSLHVLAYGFTPAQEEQLKKFRKDLYQFLAYAAQEDLPTILPHPLFFYTRKRSPPPEFFEKLLLLFERFEVLNGQRDVWQNLLTLDWIESTNEETIRLLAKKHAINPHDFCRELYRKRPTGGSDDHMGIFAGSCGTYFHLPGLSERLLREKPSALAMEALRRGESIPYGILGEEDEKLSIAFLDYFCQVAMHMKDTGLLRLFLHQGGMAEKFACLAIANGMMELRRHKASMVFLKTFHHSLLGKAPGWLTGLSVSKDYKPFFNQITKIAKARRSNTEEFITILRESIPALFNGLNTLSARRVEKDREKFPAMNLPEKRDFADLMENLEIPVHLRSLFVESGERSGNANGFSLSTLFDRLSFPLLISTVIAASSFTALLALYKGRDILNDFAEKSGRYRHPQRVLWLTDTLFDHNGVSTVLQSVLEFVRQHDLPIDFLTCGPEESHSDHLHVLPMIAEFSVDTLSPQKFRVPDLLQIQKIFSEGGYDRVVCSTEIFMGAVGLFLKEAYHIPVYLYMHTDWLDFFTRNLGMGKKESNKIRRIIRAYYKLFSGIFVLNSQHQEWLTSYRIGIPKERVFRTAHWVDKIFTNRTPAEARKPVLLFAGRLSDEKGVMDLVPIEALVRKAHPGMEVWFVGEGPARERLQTALPHARFFGWVGKEELARIYTEAGILVLPSTFDTFGCVVVEAMGCGLPVAAYRAKGPADIVEHGSSGFLADTAEELAGWIADFFADDLMRKRMSRAATERSRNYDAATIMSRLLEDIGMEGVEGVDECGPERGVVNQPETCYPSTALSKLGC